jgi:hypothetical protein
MVTVPIVEKDTKAAGYRPMQVSPGLAAVPVPQFDGQNNLMKSLQGLAIKGKENADKVAMIDAQRQLDTWEATNIFDPRTGALAKKGKDAFDLPNTLGKSFDETFVKYREKLTTDQQVMFDEMATSRRRTLMTQLYGHERGEMDNYASSAAKGLQATSENRAALYYNNPQVREAAVGSARDATILDLQRRGITDPADPIYLAETSAAESRARLGILTRYADNDPAGAVAFYEENKTRFSADDLMNADKLIVPTRRKMQATTIATKAWGGAVPVVADDDVLNFIMTDLEGGDKVVIDNNGAKAKFGINQAFTDTKVEDLDEAGARNFYKAREVKFVDDIGVMSPDMRLVAIDAAINHGGDDHTKSMILTANGDARALIAERKKYYQKLARDNPEKNGPYLRAWMNRLDKLSDQVDVLRGSVPDEQEIYKRIDAETSDPLVAKQAKEIVNAQYTVMKEDKERKWSAASEEAWNYKVNGQQVPPSVLAKMKAKDVYDMNALDEKSEPDPFFYEQTRKRILAGQPITQLNEKGVYEEVPLASLRWQLGNKFDELLKLSQDPNTSANSKAVDEIISFNQQRIIGKKTPTNDADFGKIDLFRRAMQKKIDNHKATAGSLPDEKLVQQWTDRMLLQVDTDKGLFGSSKRMYELENPVGDKAPSWQVDGVPKDRKYFLGGEEMAYSDLIDGLERKLEAKGQAVNPENISELFGFLIRKGVIVQKDQ